MEIEITKMLKEDLSQFSNSIARSGFQNIGQITWNNAKASPINFITEETREDIRDHFKEYGAWEVLDSWKDNDLNALFLQEISCALQEYLEFKEKGKEEFTEWEENFGGRIFQDKTGKVFFYVGM